LVVHGELRRRSAEVEGPTVCGGLVVTQADTRAPRIRRDPQAPLVGAAPTVDLAGFQQRAAVLGAGMNLERGARKLEGRGLGRDLVVSDRDRVPVSAATVEVEAPAAHAPIDEDGAAVPTPGGDEARTISKRNGPAIAGKLVVADRVGISVSELP